MCFGDFFTMFDVPFRYGRGWGKTEDTAPYPVIVIDDQTNQKLYGGADSVGRLLRIGDIQFTIVGVLNPWRPKPRFYDALYNGATREPAGIFMPFKQYLQLKPERNGTTMCHGTVEPGFEGFLQSECTWIQMWVQLDDERQQDAYRSFLDAYVAEQKKQGRFPRPLNNRLLPVMALLRDREVVPTEAKGILIISLLFLIVCSVNLIGILLGKFLAYAPEMGVRRALGASKTSIFTQHLFECEVVGVLGGGLGIGLSVLVLDFVNRALDNDALFQLDAKMIGSGLLLSVVAGAVAGLYPAWKICKIAPATYLKLQ